MRRAAACAAALALAGAVPLRAAGHEVLHQVERGRAVALRAFFADGKALAYAQAEVFSPADPRIPHWKGRTDRNGWLAFVPDAGGTWRVRVADSNGHGLEAEVEVDALPAAGAGGGPSSGLSGAAFVLRPAVGVALVAAIFGALYLWRRGRAR